MSMIDKYIGEFKVKVGQGKGAWEDIKVSSQLPHYDTMDNTRDFFDKKADKMVEELSKKNPGELVQVRWEFQGIGQGHYASNMFQIEFKKPEVENHA